MPFREKSAWISLLTMLGVFGAFYGAILTGALPSGGFGTVRYLLISVAAAVALQLVLRSVAAGLAREDAGTPKDERERLIELKAAQLAYAVMVAAVLGGIFAVLHTPLFGHAPGAHELALTILAAIVLSDVARSAATIAFYRLGA